MGLLIALASLLLLIAAAGKDCWRAGTRRLLAPGCTTDKLRDNVIERHMSCVTICSFITFPLIKKGSKEALTSLVFGESVLDYMDNLPGTRDVVLLLFQDLCWHKRKKKKEPLLLVKLRYIYNSCSGKVPE